MLPLKNTLINLINSQSIYIIKWMPKKIRKLQRFTKYRQRNFNFFIRNTQLSSLLFLFFFYVMRRYVFYFSNAQLLESNEILLNERWNFYVLNYINGFHSLFFAEKALSWNKEFSFISIKNFMIYFLMIVFFIIRFSKISK